MAGCRGFFTCLLKLFNFFLSVAGLGMIGYGVYLLVQWMKISSGGGAGVGSAELLRVGRPMLAVVALSDSFLEDLPKAWFIYAFIGIGAIVFIISLFGCIGIVARNRCCLCCYSFLVILMMLVEVGAAAFIFFDQSWKDKIPVDETHDFDLMYNFVNNNWEIARWVAVGVVVYEALLFLLALVVRAMHKVPVYDSDDEIITRANMRQPLTQRQPPPGPATGIPVARPVEPRQIRSDSWSTRMREKYGLDTSEFTYNPADAGRHQQPDGSSAEHRGRCNIL